jgi:hypothetical protein
MAVQISCFRVSLIWYETILALLQENPPNVPMAYLGRNYRYQPEFDRVNRQQSALFHANAAMRMEVAPPWPKPVGQKFWSYYLNSRDMGEVSGQTAWNRLVPFRIAPRFTIAAPAPVQFVLSEGFAFPQGFGWVLTLTCSGDFTPEQAASTAQALRRTCQFDATWENGQTEQCSLDLLSARVMRQLRARIFGREEQGSVLSIDPFTIFTVVQADGVDADVPVEFHAPVLRLLEAVTNWRTTWETDPLPQLPTVTIDHRTSPAGHILFGRSRGRAIWFPSLFPLPEGALRRNSLSCYHRNLVFATLQAESLLGLLAVIVGSPGSNMPGTLDSCVHNASGIVGRMYGGVADTYRSGTLRAQVDQQSLVAQVNAVRARYGMTALK